MELSELKGPEEFVKEAVEIVKLVKSNFPQARCFGTHVFDDLNMDVDLYVSGITNEQLRSLDLSGFKHLLIDEPELHYRGVYIDAIIDLEPADIPAFEEIIL